MSLSLSNSLTPEHVVCLFPLIFAIFPGIFSSLLNFGEFRQLCTKFWNFSIKIHGEFCCQSWLLLTPFGHSTVHGFGTPALPRLQWSQFWGQRESRKPALPRLLIPTKCRVSGVSGVLEFGTPAILKIETIGSLGSAGVPGIQGLPRTLDIGGLGSPGSLGVLLAIYCLMCSVTWSMSNWHKKVNFHFFTKLNIFFFSFDFLSNWT